MSGSSTALRNFSVETEALALPRGATPLARRLKVFWKGRAITVLAQGTHRAYIYPIYTPQGVSVTDESPIDHPHHNSLTIGADHVSCHYPPLLPQMTSRAEEGNYNFYVNDVFQGRAPGRVWITSAASEEVSGGHLRIVQALEWQGPVEWGAPERRVLALETRTIDIRPGENANLIDIRSQLRPAQWDLTIGPTRHAYFTIRLAEGLREIDGGVLVDSEGRRGAAAISGKVAAWVDGFGPAPHGRKAGVAVFQYPSAGNAPWSLYDWGTINVNPLLETSWKLTGDLEADVAIRVIAHDGDASEAGVDRMYQAFKAEIG